MCVSAPSHWRCLRIRDWARREMVMAASIVFEVVLIGTIKPFDKNPRKHSRSQVRRIAAIMRRLGFLNPLLVDEFGELIAGHGRLLAARKLKLASVPVIELAGLSEADKRAYVLADNKLALNAGWDDELLDADQAKIEPERVATVSGHGKMVSWTRFTRSVTRWSRCSF